MSTSVESALVFFRPSVDDENFGEKFIVRWTMDSVTCVYEVMESLVEHGPREEGQIVLLPTLDESALRRIISHRMQVPRHCPGYIHSQLIEDVYLAMQREAKA